MVAYRLTRDGFVIEDYCRARPFASFLPGIAGLWGVPMWAFYVNRGQAIAGFGVQDKDNPIMEFLPANRALRSVSLQGFRTFLKIASPRGPQFYEPFASARTADGEFGRVTRRMRIRMHDLVLEERHARLGLEVRVHYFTIPHEPLAGLARVLTIINHSGRAQRLEVLDGLPVMVPFGMRDYFLKNMSRTIEAWVTVRNLERRAPFYQLKTEVHDRPEVVPIRAGNFSVCLARSNGTTRLAEPVIDPALIFGDQDDLIVPARYLAPSFRLPARQTVQDKTPCAMARAKLLVPPHQEAVLYSLFGHADSVEALNRSLASIATPDFFAAKADQNRVLIDELTRPIATGSRNPAFDLYCRQTFLDNVMRGGTPVRLGTNGRAKVVYVYSRKHGDLERDYNHFVIPPTHFSQGNANYRDVNQNRRSDVWFHPEVGDQNVVTFFNLLQADGFNPLVYKGTRYVAATPGGVPAAVRELLAKPFTPGELLRQVERRQIPLKQPAEAFLDGVMRTAKAVEDADHGEGFWTDHWTYTLDLLESYLSVYPERLRELLLEKRIFTFYDNPHVVAPRAQRYRLGPHGLRQFHAVRRDPEKAALIQSRTAEPHVVRTKHGRGPIYRTTLLVKMVCVVTNKLASLDPFGVGIEMEADKPNWFDALNGLPGLVGSSSCETFELKRWIVFLQHALKTLRLPDSARIALPEELADFLRQLSALLRTPASTYWRASATAKERYRERVRLGFSGRERAVRVGALAAWLKAAQTKTERGLARAYDRRRGLFISYFSYQPAGARRKRGLATAAIPSAWAQHALPPFLEGLVHALRLEPSLARARALYRAVKRSSLYDRTLAMYRVCAPLAGESEEIGRCRVFNPGWLEHGSIWLHMEYKYLLELLRCGLYEEFYRDAAKALIPFQPPGRYGRSILENSSFLVSSLYADRRLHGAGFVARLSGATAEFLQMWLWMTVGRRPFALNRRGELTLRLTPVLSKKCFDARGRFTFRLLGTTEVTYLNPSRRATFGAGRVAPATIRLRLRAGGEVALTGDTIPHPYAAMVRAGAIARLEVTLASPSNRGGARRR